MYPTSSGSAAKDPQNEKLPQSEELSEIHIVIRAVNQYATPCQIIASQTFSKPAIFAPATRLPGMP